jgi:hypothetical protein
MRSGESHADGRRSCLTGSVNALFDSAEREAGRKQPSLSLKTSTYSVGRHSMVCCTRRTASRCRLNSVVVLGQFRGLLRHSRRVQFPPIYDCARSASRPSDRLPAASQGRAGFFSGSARRDDLRGWR